MTWPPATAVDRITFVHVGGPGELERVEVVVEFLPGNVPDFVMELAGNLTVAELAALDGARDWEKHGTFQVELGGHQNGSEWTRYGNVMAAVASIFATHHPARSR